MLRPPDPVRGAPAALPPVPLSRGIVMSWRRASVPGGNGGAGGSPAAAACPPPARSAPHRGNTHSQAGGTDGKAGTRPHSSSSMPVLPSLPRVESAEPATSVPSILRASAASSSDEPEDSSIWRPGKPLPRDPFALKDIVATRVKAMAQQQAVSLHTTLQVHRAGKIPLDRRVRSDETHRDTSRGHGSPRTLLNRLLCPSSHRLRANTPTRPW